MSTAEHLALEASIILSVRHTYVSTVCCFAVALGLELLGGCASVATYPRTAVALPTAVASVREPEVEPFAYPIVIESGSSQQLGTTHGEKLGADVRYLHDAYLSQFVSSKTQAVMAGVMAMMFKNFIVPEHLAEIDAIAAATHIERREVLLGQCFLDLTPMSACSTVALPASASVDRIARMGRNLDFWSLGVADRYTKLFIIKPTDGRYAFASVGWPGTIGTLSGMNEFGLTLANMEVPRDVRFPQAMPYPLLYRRLLERCRTVPEAIELLKRTPIQTANNVMLMDAAGTRAVVELMPPRSVFVRLGLPDRPLLSTNHQRGADQDTAGKCWRYDRMHKSATAAFGELDVESVERIMKSVAGETTLQSMVFEPSTQRLYLAAGKSAGERKYSRIDLAPYFQRPQTLAAR